MIAFPEFVVVSLAERGMHVGLSFARLVPPVCMAAPALYRHSEHVLIPGPLPPLPGYR